MTGNLFFKGLRNGLLAALVAWAAIFWLAAAPRAQTACSYTAGSQTISAAFGACGTAKSDVGHTHSGLAPTGGTTGQVLKKNSNTNYDYSWQVDGGSGGGGTWGSITGTLSSQTDLWTELGNKQPLDADLTGLAGLSSSGIVVRTGAGTFATRQVLDFGGGGVDVINNDGVAGDIGVSLDFSDKGADAFLASNACNFTNPATVPGHLVCEGATANTIETRFNIVDPTTADKTVTVPDANTVIPQAATCSGTDKFSALNGTTGATTCSADDDVPDANEVNTAAVQANAVTNAKLAQMANATLKCRTTAGSGDPEDCTTAQVNALLGTTGSVAFQGALVTKSAVQNITGAATATWNTETYDYGGWHDNVTNNSRLTVPTGVSRVRVTAVLRRASATDQIFARIAKNGTNIDALGAGGADTDTAGADTVNLVSAVLEVVPGDYFEIEVTMGVTADLAAESWFAIDNVATGQGVVNDADYGDWTMSGAGTTATLDANVVTNAKAAQMPANTLKGNNTGATANALDLTTTQVKALLGYVVSADIDTSAELRTILSDETGTGALMFGLTTAMANDIGCTALQSPRRNAGNTAWECAAGGGSTWGSITGTLSSQTDLQTALDGKVNDTGDTMTGPLITAASGTGAAGFRLPHGTAPTVATDGDVWSTSGGLFLRVTGTTLQFASLQQGNTFSSGQTFNGGAFVAASSTSLAGLRLAHGVDPTVPTNGDTWTTTTAFKTRLNGATASFAGVNTGDQTITLTGDVTGSGTGSFAATIAANSVALTTDTTGNYVADVTAGTGIAVTGSAGEGWAPAVALNYSDAGTDPALNADECRFTSNASISGFIVCEGDTANAFETRIMVADPTADRAFTIPNADSNPVQPLTCGGTDKVSAISSTGVITCSADSGGGGGSGDVVGPASAGDGDAVAFDGTTGKLVKDTAVNFGADGVITSLTNSGANAVTVPLLNYIMLTADYALTNATTEQKAFNTTTNGRLTLPTGVYRFNCHLFITGMSATSGSASFDFVGAGTAVTSRWGWATVGADTGTVTTGVTVSGTGGQVSQQSVGGVVGGATATALQFSPFGLFRVTTTGTVIPSISLSTASAATMKAGSYCTVEKIGDQANATQGAWD